MRVLLFHTKRTVKSSFKNLWMHRLRSALTTLGIILGVSSVIAMLAVGEGASRHVQEQVEILRPGGGAVFQQVHNIMANVPPENIVAMFDAVNAKT